MTALTRDNKHTLWEIFTSAICPVCKRWKQVRWCFCQTCYFTLKKREPALAKKLYTRIQNGTDEFWESYARARTYLKQIGLADPKRNERPRSGDLFA